MQLEKLLLDATQMPAGTSQRAQHMRLAELLNERHGEGAITLKGVEKWFLRRSIPAPWLLKIVTLRDPALNLADYA